MSAWEDAVGELRTLVSARTRTLLKYRESASNPAEWRIAHDMATAAQERLDHAVLRAAIEVAEGREPQP